MNLKLIVMSILMGVFVAGISAVKAEIENGSKPLVIAQAVPDTKQESSLKTSVKTADYAFQGVVTKIEYRISENTPQIPHTFVTFQVEKFLKGSFNQQFITLRFAGGVDSNGNLVTGSVVPLFDIGDQDILLVKDNGQSACPLVECEAGRFRIIKNQVFTNQGQPISLNSQGELVNGKPLLLNEVLTNKIGQTVFKDVYSNEEGRHITQVQEVPSLSPSQLELLIKNQVIQLSASGELQRQQFVVSVDSQKKFVIEPPKPLSPPQIAAPRIESAIPSSEADRRELEMLEQNGSNPVFPNSKP